MLLDDKFFKRFLKVKDFLEFSKASFYQIRNTKLNASFLYISALLYLHLHVSITFSQYYETSGKLFMNNVLVIVYLFYQPMELCLIIYLNVSRASEMISVWEKLDQFEKKDMSSLKRNVLLSIILELIYYGIYNVISALIPSTNNQNEINLYLVLILNLTNYDLMVRIMTEQYYYVTFATLTKLLRDCEEKLRSINRSNATEPVKDFEKISDLATRTSRLLGWQLLLMIAKYFICILLFSFDVYSSIVYGTSIGYGWTYHLFSGLYKIFYITFVSQKWKREVERFKRAMFLTSVQVKSFFLKRSLHIASISLLHNNLNVFAGRGFFIVDSSVFFTVVTTWSNYFLISLQMHASYLDSEE